MLIVCLTGKRCDPHQKFEETVFDAKKNDKGDQDEQRVPNQGTREHKHVGDRDKRSRKYSLSLLWTLTAKEHSETVLAAVKCGCLNSRLARRRTANKGLI
ncbi:hypothetical protein TNCT_267831 [Trichonephila clavata]|uniref:Uncharacterized protein n=1 Tax=Trichonephila clavata TaxID=2740835 RepID=A0A8X6LHI3_TRICU|nr:hypothetical protein TNCT_267831 [Trichonephila clavata]